MANIEERVFGAVTARSPAAKNLKIASVQSKFLDGTLYTVSFDVEDNDGDIKSFINRVYVKGRSIEVYGFDDQLLAIVGATHGSGILSSLSEPRLIASVIAIAITLLVCVALSIGFFSGTNPEIPDFLSSGFLLILGFYFGKLSNRSDSD